MTYKNVSLFLAWVMALSMFMVGATPALAAQFMAPTQDNQGVISVPASQPAKNLYVVGSLINLNQATGGDLVAAGGTINLDNAVEKDAILAGGTINIGGEIGDTLRAVGATINLRKVVLGDAVLGGGTINIDHDANIGGDLVAAAGTVNASSKVSGSATLVGGSVVISGEITGDVIVRANKLVILPSAKIANLKYYGPGQPEIQAGSLVGHVETVKVDYMQKKTTRTFNPVGFVFKLLILIISGLVLIWVFKGRNNAVSKLIIQKPWVSLLTGLVVLVAMPIAAVICIVFFGLGVYIGLFVAFFYVALLLFAFLSGMVTSGGWINQKLTKRSDMLLDWQAVVIGAAAVCLVGIIPYVGGLLVFLWTLIALGATWKDLVNQEKHRNQA
jgi:hypothetical protein